MLSVIHQVKVVYFNDTPIPDKLLHLFEGKRWSVTQLIQNLTTDSDGIASFSLNTFRFQDNFQLAVSVLPKYQEYQGTRTPYYEDSEHTLKLFRPKMEDTPTISSLEVKKRETKLVCDVDKLINVSFTFVGEAPGPVDIIYLILARGAITSQGHIKVEVLDEPDRKDMEASIELAPSYVNSDNYERISSTPVKSVMRPPPPALSTICPETSDSCERVYVLAGVEELHESSYHEVPVGELDTRIDWDYVTWQSGMDSASVSTLEEGDTKELDSDDADSDDFVPRIRMCPRGHTVWRWSSQPSLKYGMSSGDFMLATNLLLSGNNYAKIELLFKFMNIV
ncbi:hypothetical protein N1851_021866 [Merluccius polli]|uniref:Uncharacterized protein n=1 Tax=Merluccius polli TaxID=89951 RepID=A0AA47NWC7_MERPO|nr:hypothetical protein N1851_021866 [Merluccius polli]